MNDVIREFLLETHENLAQLDTDLVALEKDPTERQTLARVFRTLHSVKGTAGFIGLPKLQAVAHAAESLLSRLRAGELAFNRPIATGVLGVVDAVRQMLASVEAGDGEGSGDYSGTDRATGQAARDRRDRGESRPVRRMTLLRQPDRKLSWATTPLRMPHPPSRGPEARTARRSHSYLDDHRRTARGAATARNRPNHGRRWCPTAASASTSGCSTS